MNSPSGRSSHYARPLSFSGDADCHNPTDVGALDVDYKPSDDPSGQGGMMRKHLWQRLIDLGIPCYLSRSGNGFHALWRAHPSDFGISTGWQQRPEHWPQEALQGLQVEVFAPGNKKALGLRLQGDLDEQIPIITRQQILGEVRHVGMFAQRTESL